jgi:predicted phosphodiesterase
MISDTHDFAPDQKVHVTPYRHPFPTADLLLHAGDLTMVGQETEHQLMVDMLKQAPAELKLVIAGNHDITLDPPYYNSYGFQRHTNEPQDLGRIRELYCGEEAQRHGIVYMDEGLRTFTLSNGARFTVYATPYQPEFCQWAFAYERTQDRFNPSAESPPENPVPDFPNVDIMLTHGPPQGVRDLAYERNVGCEHLLRAVARARPLLHCFGHIHEGHGAQLVNWETQSSAGIIQDRSKELQDRGAYLDVSSESEDPLRVGEETLFVNASVVTKSYRPLNAPWLVDMDLPSAADDDEKMSTG